MFWYFYQIPQKKGKKKNPHIKKYQQSITPIKVSTVKHAHTYIIHLRNYLPFLSCTITKK